jgi:DNA-binding NarL/FixJ family response regulator
MKILVVDDHVLIRDALRALLKELNEHAVVLEASNGRQAMRLIGEHDDLKLVLLDLNLPDCNGYEMLADLSESRPDLSVVVLTGQQDRDAVIRAFDLGAAGFIPKSGQREVMVGALQLVFAGGVYIPPEILAHGQSPQSSKEGAAVSRMSPSDFALTERQLDVLALMVQGKSNKAICRVLNLAEATVKKHVTEVLKALNVTNRTEAVIAVKDMGWQLPTVLKS